VLVPEVIFSEKFSTKEGELPEGMTKRTKVMRIIGTEMINKMPRKRRILSGKDL
jgi:hypothetical protein